MKLQLLITLLGASYGLAQTCNKGSMVCCKSFQETAILTRPLEGIINSSGNSGGTMKNGQKTGIKCDTDLEGCQRDKLACCGLEISDNYIDCSIPKMTTAEYNRLIAPQFDDEGRPKRKHLHGGGLPGLDGIADVPGL